jgi:hypothetical protein
VHESSGIAQELVWFRKDQVEVPSETLPFFHKEWGKILEFIFRVNSTKFAISEKKTLLHYSTQEVSSPWTWVTIGKEK